MTSVFEQMYRYSKNSIFLCLCNKYAPKIYCYYATKSKLFKGEHWTVNILKEY